MKIFFCLIVLMIGLHGSAWARKLGLGAMLGNPTGLNGKYWVDNNRAVDGGLGFSLGKHSDVNLYSDYLLHEKDALYFNEIHPLDLHYGIGGRMEFGEGIELGVRFPVGLSYDYKEKAADIFGEIAPIVDFVGRLGFEISIGVGARYYF